MNKSIKILSLFVGIICFFSCDTTTDEVAAPGELVAKYTYVREATEGKITFINTSENADTFLWEFGDTPATSSTVKNPVKTFSATGNYNVKLTATNSKTGASQTFSSSISVTVFQGGLVSNGNFESGTMPWTLGIANALPSTLILTNNNNKYFSVNVTAVGNPFDVNLSHKGINMIQNRTYRLTFDAWSDVNRTIVVGIGLSGGSFTNQSVTRNLTTTIQSFSIDLVANFTDANSRVLFDMGAAVGRVNIDNVTLNLLP